MANIVLVVPVYNEEQFLEFNVGVIREFLKRRIKDRVRIVIGDNASTDASSSIGRHLSRKYRNVDYFRIEKKGRGFALKKIWLHYDADIYSYMDIDLPFNLETYMEIIKRIKEGYDICMASKSHPESSVIRKRHRQILTRGFSLLNYIMFSIPYTDTQGGMKAVSKRVRDRLVPKMGEDGWYFDTELVIVAHDKRYKIKELPTTCADNRESSVVWKDVYKMLVSALKTKLRIRRGKYG
jgi:glycosyltransferase involved in cell wall biosynthesis